MLQWNRYIVRYFDAGDRGCSHAAVTRMGRDKAVAMATYNHIHHHEEIAVYSVEVEEMGKVDTLNLDDEDITDRDEF